MKSSILAGAAALALALGSCAATDVVGAAAKASFAEFARASGDRVSWSTDRAAWVIRSPGGEEVAVSADFRGSPDLAFFLDAAPFLAAGLVPSKLSKSDNVGYSVADGRLELAAELGPEPFSLDAMKSLDFAFSEILRTNRSRIGYHEKLDHFGLALGAGNMLEWAKDPTTNDKDLVFVLAPEPLVAAGLDPAKVPGWLYAPVETKDASGKAVTVQRLLKPYDLE